MALRIVCDFDEEGLGGGPGFGGWSEVYWLGTGTIDSYLQLQPNGDPVSTCPANVLKDTRLELLAPTYRMSHMRVTDTILANGERSADFNSLIGTGRWPGVAAAAESFAKLLVRLESGPTRRRNLWIGGIPEAIVQPPNAYRPNPTWTDKFAAFSALMTGGGYGIYGRPLRTAAQPITSFGTFDALGETAQVQPVPAGFPAPGNYAYVVIRGVRQPRGWNGVHLAVLPASPATYVIIGPTRRSQVTTPAFAANARSTIQLLSPVFVGTDRVRPIRISRRKIGRPFGAEVGRRSG